MQKFKIKISFFYKKTPFRTNAERCFVVSIDYCFLGFLTMRPITITTANKIK